MSWLSDRLGTTGKTPAIIKSIGNVVGKEVIAKVPGASSVASALDLFGDKNKGVSVQQMATNVAKGVVQDVNTAAQAANAAANANAAKTVTGDGLRLFFSTPLGWAALAGFVLVVFLVARRR